MACHGSGGFGSSSGNLSSEAVVALHAAALVLLGYFSWPLYGAYALFFAVGTAGADVQLWDAGAGRQVRSMRGHAARVGSPCPPRGSSGSPSPVPCRR